MSFSSLGCVFALRTFSTSHFCCGINLNSIRLLYNIQEYWVHLQNKIKESDYAMKIIQKCLTYPLWCLLQQRERAHSHFQIISELFKKYLKNFLGSNWGENELQCHVNYSETCDVCIWADKTRPGIILYANINIKQSYKMINMALAKIKLFKYLTQQIYIK